MPLRFNLREQVALGSSLVKWCVLGVCVGILAGLASSLFLIGLGWATATRSRYPWLLCLLPLGGALIGWIYGRFGKDVEGGNNLLLERIHRANGDVPWRMAPLIALSTIGTHLLGGSAGREGTAVQMGGSLANLLAQTVRLRPADRRILLMSGISGGFGSVFGTPIAGTIFGLEVLTVGRIRYDALVPCFVASTIGDLVCRMMGVSHRLYPIGLVPEITPSLLVFVATAGLLFGAASLLFSELTHAVEHLAQALVSTPWLRPFYGGLVIIALTALFGTTDYLGLGLPLIEQSFSTERASLWTFAVKMLFTAVTLGTGFKGGEVTPLFCIGATLGAAFASLIGQPVAPFAAMGFVAVFAGAANTPLACVLMGIELFGSALAVPLTLACIVSYIASGHRGIYLSQEVDTPKAGTVVVPFGAALRDAHAGALEVLLPSAFPMLRMGRSVPQTRKNMTASHHHRKFQATAYGQLRVFLRSGERTRPKGWRERLSNPPVYMRIIQSAREFGLAHGTVKQCVSGFMDRGQLQHDHLEYGNSRLPVYVELLGTRAMLEDFCHHSAELLHGRVIVYKDVERWHWSEPEIVSVPAEEDEEMDMAG